MRMVRAGILKDWIAWMLIAGGLIVLGKVGLDAGLAALYQRQYQSALHDASLEEPSVPAEAAASASLGQAIGWLEIPRIGVSAAVVHGDSGAVLKNAIGHLPDTPLPWREGNSALAAHRDTFFRPLRDVRRGDMVRLKTPAGYLNYRVHETFVVDPEDVWVLDSTRAAMLTLITCYPFAFVGNAPQRFIVRAERIESPQQLSYLTALNDDWLRNPAAGSAYRLLGAVQ